MAEYLDEEGQDVETQDFDINDPDFANLENFAPEIDTEDVPKQIRPAPPADGYHWVNARLANKDGGAVYIKGTKGPGGKVIDGKVVAAIDCRVWDEEKGEEGAFLKTLYATTLVFKGAKGSQLTAICYLAGKPVKAGAGLGQIRDHVLQLFAEAGEEGIRLLVRTRWIKSVPKVTELMNPDGSATGVFQYVFKEGTEIKDYLETKGEQRIKRAAQLVGIPEEQAHLFKEPVTGEDRYVQAEVAEIADPSLLS